MSLTHKVVTRLAVAITIVIILTFSVAFFIILRSFLKIEQDSLITNTQRVRDVLQSRIDDINTKASDWANWDDTYNFIKTDNPNYVASNFAVASFPPLNLNLALIFDNDHQLKAGINVDISSGKNLPVPQKLVEYLTQQHPELITFTTPNDSHTGIVVIDGQPILIASRSVSNSAIDVPPRGAFVFGRYLDAGLIQDISSISHNQVSLAPAVPPGSASGIIVKNISANQQQAEIILPDLLKQPALMLTVTRDRPIYTSALSTLSFFSLIIVISLVVIIFINYQVIRSTILTPLSTFINKIGFITSEQDFSSRMPQFDSLELQTLSQTLNSMLKKLEESKSALEEKVSQLEKVNEMMVDRELKMTELKTELAKYAADK
jgi:sensor domain CHASE-containing protein